MRGRLIVVEGTDCSGKETQSKLLQNYLEEKGRKVFYFSFPNYNSPTGKIIGGPYLGKPQIGEGWFLEGAPKVNPKVASLYYAADRLYNLPIYLEKLENGYDVILDRFTYSNMAHQGCKYESKEQRKEIFEWFAKLEFEMLGLPIPEIRIFIHMPFLAGKILRENREEKLDQHEQDDEYLKKAEETYLEIAEMYDFKTIECQKNDTILSTKDIKTPEEISKEIINYINQF